MSEFTEEVKTYLSNMNDEEIVRLKDEYTCEECEKSFVDKETGINAPSICMACWNAMVTKLRAEIDKKEEALTRIATWAKAYPQLERVLGIAPILSEQSLRRTTLTGKVV